MLNIINNANITIKLSLSKNGLILEEKRVCLNPNEAESLFDSFNSLSQEEIQNLNIVTSFIEESKFDILDSNCDYELNIEFDEKFIEEMKIKKPIIQYYDASKEFDAEIF